MNNNCNLVTGHIYQGKNAVELEAHRLANGWKEGKWLTFLQAQELGLKIIKGSKSYAVFKGYGSFTELDEDKKPKTHSAPLGFARVFNVEQTEKAKENE